MNKQGKIVSELTDKEARELWVLLHLREALGDPTGKLMQDELVERARNAWADAQRYRWLRDKGSNTWVPFTGQWKMDAAHCDAAIDNEMATQRLFGAA